MLNDSACQGVAGLQFAQLFINLYHLMRWKRNIDGRHCQTLPDCRAAAELQATAARADLALELVLLDVQRVLGRQVVQAELRQLEAVDLFVVEPQQVLQVGNLRTSRHQQ